MPAYSLGTMGAWAVTSHTDQIISGAKTFQAIAADSVPVRIKGAANHTANLMEFQDSAGAVLAGVQGSGYVFVGSSHVGGHFSVQPLAAGNRAMVVRGLAAQAGDLVQYQNSAGTVLGKISPAGGIFFSTTGTDGASDHTLQTGGGNSINFTAGTHRVTAASASAPPLQVIAAASQTASLQEWKNSAGSVLARVEAAGDMVLVGNRAFQTGPNPSGKYLNISGGVGPTVDRATMFVSNGNLHIDCANTFGIYLGWYATSFVGTIFGNGAGTQVGRLDAGGAMSAVSFTSTSRLDTKMNVERVLETGPDDEKLMSLSAVRYNSVLDNRDRPLHSFVAEEVAEIMPEIVSFDEGNEVAGINLTSLVTILTTQVQNLTARVRELEAAQ